MVQTYHPCPIISVAKFVVIALLVTILLFLIKKSVEQFFFTFLLGMWAAALFFSLVSYVYSRVRSVVLEDKAIVYSSGLIAVKKTILHYPKITEVNYSQGLMQRIFGIGTLNLDTAGGNNIAITVSDLNISDLKKIVHDINEKSTKKHE